MKALLLLAIFLPITAYSQAKKLPVRYTELVPYVQAAPDQGETNTCWFMASTGALELLLNKKHKIRNPKRNGKFDLSESFLIWQSDVKTKWNRPKHFIQEMVMRFNNGEAIQNKFWPYQAKLKDGTVNEDVWAKHESFDDLPRIKVPPVESLLLFAKGGKWDTGVLEEEDLLKVKEALVKHRSPVIINYNDEDYWHVVLIVGYDDKKKGVCYEIPKSSCNSRGAFIVRDSDGKRTEARAYNWFLEKANAAAVVKLRE